MWQGEKIKKEETNRPVGESRTTAVEPGCQQSLLCTKPLKQALDNKSLTMGGHFLQLAAGLSGVTGSPTTRDTVYAKEGWGKTHLAKNRPSEAAYQPNSQR